MNKLIVISFYFFVLVITTAFAQEGAQAPAAIRLGVGEAQNEAAPLAIAVPMIEGNLTTNDSRLVEQAHQVFLSDFNWYRKYFSVLKPELLGSVSASTYFSPNYASAQSRGHAWALNLKAKRGAGDKITLSVAIHNVRAAKLLGEEQIDLSAANVRAQAHALANKAYKLMMGKESIFTSKIYFVSDYGSSGKTKELFVMDFDGQNKSKLTSHNANVVGPAISHNGRLLAYTLIKVVGNRRTVDLFLMDLSTGKIKIVSNRPGINSGPVFTPDDQYLLLTMSFSGDAEIYKLNLENSKYYPLTKDSGDDVDPSVALDGDLYAFLSSRSGKAHAYTASLVGTEKNVKRISYVGKFNATPRISPDGKTIVFASWIDERFDLVRVNATDAKNMVRLTKDFGSNEDPDWSKDNEFITFASQRVLSRKDATQDIYLMDRDGEILGKVTENFGKCSMPRFTR